VVDRLLIFVAGGGLFLALFVIAVLLSPTRGAARSNRILAALVGVASLNILHPVAVLVFPDAMVFHQPFLIEPIEFLIPPLVASYYRVLISGVPIRGRDWPHILPFLATTSLVLSPLPALWARMANPGLLASLLWSLLLLEIALYYHSAFRLLGAYRRALRDETSNVAGLDLIWLSRLSWSIVGLFASYSVVLVLMLKGSEDFHVRALLTIALGAFIAMLGYRGMLQNDRTAAFEGTEFETETEPGRSERGGSDVLAPDRAEAIRSRLLDAMETERPWLDPDLDLSSLATSVAATRNQLSFVVNRLLGKNFYDFVNEYRVREVLRLMADPARKDDKLLSIALDAGFNSKPTFNKVMVKLSGKTPSQTRAETIGALPSDERIHTSEPC